MVIKNLENKIKLVLIICSLFLVGCIIISILFVFISQEYSVVLMKYILCISSPVDGQSDCFHILTFMNNPAVNFMCKSLCGHIFLFLLN